MVSFFDLIQTTKSLGELLQFAHACVTIIESIIFCFSCEYRIGLSFLRVTRNLNALLPIIEAVRYMFFAFAVIYFLQVYEKEEYI